MKIDLQELLPAKISNEAAFHVVKFTRDLAIALEAATETCRVFRLLGHSNANAKAGVFGNKIRNGLNCPRFALKWNARGNKYPTLFGLAFSFSLRKAFDEIALEPSCKDEPARDSDCIPRDKSDPLLLRIL